MNPISAIYWLRAARAGFAKPHMWRGWADERIQALPDAPYWLLCVSTALNEEGLAVAAAAAWESIDKEYGAFVPETVIKAGYLWWRHLLGELSLHECLAAVSKEVDCEDHNVKMGPIYDLIDQLGRETQRHKVVEAYINGVHPILSASNAQWKVRRTEEIEVQASKVFAPYFAVVHAQWNAIQSDR